MHKPTDAERLVGADRVLAVLVELGEHPEGISLDELATTMDSAKPTIHRALTSLKRAGLAAQVDRGTYMLGDEFLRLAFRNISARPETAAVAPLLDAFASRYGETTHYAVLDDADVVYRAKADPPSGAVRLTSVVGGRNPAYCTAVGKALLAERAASLAQLTAIVGDAPFASRTENTLTTVDALWKDLVATRERGYAIDDQENEHGVNCIAIPVRARADGEVSGAISISALSFRTPLDRLTTDAPRVIADIREAHL